MKVRGYFYGDKGWLRLTHRWGEQGISLHPSPLDILGDRYYNEQSQSLFSKNRSISFKYIRKWLRVDLVDILYLVRHCGCSWIGTEALFNSLKIFCLAEAQYCQKQNEVLLTFIYIAIVIRLARNTKLFATSTSRNSLGWLQHASLRRNVRQAGPKWAYR